MQLETATLANGCFWCTEAVFKRLKGVESVKPGYTGGTVENPTYTQVGSGTTGHAEAIEVIFDPHTISYKMLLEIFFATHDPTTKNRQGADVGTEYRSAIFYHSDSQMKVAEEVKKELNDSSTYNAPIVTQIVPFTHFYEAEEYHKNYYEKNEGAPYCTIVIDPKIKKLIKTFSKQLKDEYKPK